MLKQNTEHRTRKQFEVKNTNIKKIQKMGVIFSKRLDKERHIMSEYFFYDFPLHQIPKLFWEDILYVWDNV